MCQIYGVGRGCRLAVQLMWVLISHSVVHYSNSYKLQHSYWVSNSNTVLEGVLCSLYAYHITLQFWMTSALYSEVLKVFVQTGTTLAYT